MCSDVLTALGAVRGVEVVVVTADPAAGGEVAGSRA